MWFFKALFTYSAVTCIFTALEKHRSPLGHTENNCFLCVIFTLQGAVQCAAIKCRHAEFYRSTLDRIVCHCTAVQHTALLYSDMNEVSLLCTSNKDRTKKGRGAVWCAETRITPPLTAGSTEPEQSFAHTLNHCSLVCGAVWTGPKWHPLKFRALMCAGLYTSPIHLLVSHTCLNFLSVVQQIT